MASTYPFVRAVNTLVFAAQPTANDTVTIGGREYTFVATPSSEDEVARGASATAARDNLIAYINSDPDSIVVAVATESELDPAIEFTLKTPGANGNFVPAASAGVTEPVWTGATFSGGEGEMPGWSEDILRYNQVNSELKYELLNVAGLS